MSASLVEGVGGEPSGDVARSIGRQLTGSLAPVQPLPPNRVLVSQTAAVFVALPLLAALTVGAEGLWSKSWAQSLGLLGVVAASDILLSLSLCSLMVPGCRPSLSPRLLLAAGPLAFVLAALALYPAQSTPDAVSAGVRCVGAGIAVAIPAAVALWALARRGAVLDWARTGAVVGLLAGLTGATFLTLHCAFLGRAHQCLSHGALVLGSALAGWLLGAFAERRARPV